jgi:hypothetical protein
MPRRYCAKRADRKRGHEGLAVDVLTAAAGSATSTVTKQHGILPLLGIAHRPVGGLDLG